MNTLPGPVDALLFTEVLRGASPSPVAGVVRTAPVALAGSHLRAAAQSTPGSRAVLAPATSAPVSGGKEPTLSSAARLLGELLAPLPASPGPVMGAVPLLAASPAHAPHALAARLAEAVATSGLFYESHLAGVADGSLPAAALAREPQARWDAGRSGLPTAEADPASRHDGAPAERAHAPAAQRDALQGAHLAPQARTLVAQQLELLASGVFRWQGEAWPGVPMEWAVQQEREPHAQQGEAAARWCATLSLVLPRLGRVDIRVALADRSLGASVAAGAAATAHLREAGEELRACLAAAGFDSPRVALDEVAA